MKKTNWLVWSLWVLILVASVKGATLHGQIYDLELELVKNVLVEIDTVPQQQYLAKEGTYSFEVPEGEYVLKARKGELEAEEEIKVVGEGEFVFDLFLFPGFEEEDELWEEMGEIEREQEEKGFFGKYPLGSYLAALGILLVAIGRIILARKKYKKVKRRGVKKTEERIRGELKEEKEEPGYLEETLEVIKRHEGRISQRELRKEMLHLSEAKISLILTELEHKGKIEKIKKGRGNVVILK